MPREVAEELGQVLHEMVVFQEVHFHARDSAGETCPDSGVYHDIGMASKLIWIIRPLQEVYVQSYHHKPTVVCSLDFDVLGRHTCFFIRLVIYQTDRESFCRDNCSVDSSLDLNG